MSIRRLFLGDRAPRGPQEPERKTEPSARTGWRRAFGALRRDPLAGFGLVWIALLIATATIGPRVAPYPDQGAGRTKVEERLEPPSRRHPLGTDELGRDILSRIIFGTRPALVSSLVVVTMAVAIGMPLGAIAGLYGGWLDDLIMRVTDLFLAFPSLLLAMAIVALLGPSLLHAVIALAVSWWPWYTRLVRGVTLTLREQAFVEAARGLGASGPAIIVRHILPNSLTPVLIQATLDVGTVILATTGLAFVGLGSQPPQADWGLMIEEGRAFLRNHWWFSTFPGAAIFLSVLAFNLVGDVLRDLFDPRQYR